MFRDLAAPFALAMTPVGAISSGTHHGEAVGHEVLMTHRFPGQGRVDTLVKTKTPQMISQSFHVSAEEMKVALTLYPAVLRRLGDSTQPRTFGSGDFPFTTRAGDQMRIGRDLEFVHGFDRAGFCFGGLDVDDTSFDV
jgi:hypothetical protein